VALCLAAINGTLGRARVDWDPRAALGVVIAAGGYPGSYEKGQNITGLDAADGSTSKIFHAGTRSEGGRVITNGGRVLCVVALGDTVSIAQQLAYRVADGVDFEGAFTRRDIGYRAVARETAA
jgi:phosphoribosylamine--glycine ligase